MPELSPLEVELICDAKAIVGESPLFVGKDIVWTDPASSELLSFSADTGLRRVALAQPVWSIAKSPDGQMVAALDDAIGVIERPNLLTVTSAAKLPAGHRFNDMTVDEKGGVWIGSMHRGVLATTGAIYRAPRFDRPLRLVASGLGMPNGIKVSGDGRTLFVIDTLARMLLAYPIEDHALGQPVVISDFLDIRGKPDGLELAGDGSAWVAMWGAGLVVQLSPDGANLRMVPVDAPHVTSLCFAGAARLVVSSSRKRLSPAELCKSPGSGGLFEIRF